MSFDLASLLRPIVVLGTPRSGTSLTAGLFAQHGAWVGHCREGDGRNARGYFENEALKRELIDVAGRLDVNPRIPGLTPTGEWRDRVLSILHREGYTGGPWLFKHGALYAPLWMRDFDPVFVCCFRAHDDVIASGTTIGMMDARIAPRSIEIHQQYMQRLVDEHDAHKVWPEEFVQHRWTALIEAFAEAGLAFDHEIAEDFVDPKLWHDWSTAHAAPA